MEALLLDEIIRTVVNLKPEDRQKVMRAVQEKKKEERGTKTNGKEGGEKGIVHPNTIWIKKHHAEYAGKHVALKDGELVAFGDTIKEADVKAKEKGVEKYMLTYLFPMDSEPFGGW